MLNLKSANTKGKKVISHCLNKAINNVIQKIIIAGIAAISLEEYSSKETKIP